MNMKKIILIITILVTTSIYTQNSDIIKITTSASGITKEIAVQDALRSALEQSYGSFISTKTSIKNDELINDEIVSITNGDIHRYEIISEYILDGRYNVTIESEISLNQINTFKKQIGESATKFDGALFGVKIKLQEINEKSERISLKNLFVSLYNIYNESIDITLDNYAEPKIISNTNNYSIDFEVGLAYNSNILTFNNHLTKSLKSIAMNQTENELYSSLGKSTYRVILDGENYYFRNIDSMHRIVDFLYSVISQNYFHYELSDNNEILFDPNELLRRKNSLDRDRYNKKKQQLLAQEGKFLLNVKSGYYYASYMEWVNQRNSFYIPGIYISGSNPRDRDIEQLNSGDAKYFTQGSINFNRGEKCYMSNNYSDCREFNYIMHFASKSSPFTYLEEGVINSRKPWMDGNIVIKEPYYGYDYTSYNSRGIAYRNEKYSNKYGEIFDFIPLWKINGKNDIGFRLINSSIAPIIVQSFIPKGSNKTVSEYRLWNPNDLGNGKVFKIDESKGPFNLTDDLFSGKSYITAGTAIVSLDYELYQRSYEGYSYNYDLRAYENKYSYNSVNSDLSNIKLSKKKKQELKRIINTPNKTKASNLNSLIRYLSADFTTKWNFHRKTSLDPYAKTTSVFKITLQFSKEKLSNISEFKLEKSTDTYNPLYIYK